MPSKGVVIGMDTELRAFQVAVRSSGRRFYRVRDDRTKAYITVGEHGVLTADEARRRAKWMLAELANGRDPRPPRRPQRPVQEQREGRTVPQLADAEYAEHHRKEKVTHRRRQNLELWLNSYITPELGALLVQDVVPEDIEAFHARHQRIPASANHMLLMLRSMFDRAEEDGLRPKGSNPCKGVKFYPRKDRQRFLTYDEVVRLWTTIAEMEAENWISAVEADYFRLKLLTGARMTELINLKWPQVHLDLGYYELPKHKTWGKTKQARIVPLSDDARDLIARQPRLGEHVLWNPPGLRHSRNGPYRCGGQLKVYRLNNIWRGNGTGRERTAMRVRAGIPDAVMHDIRRTAASIAGGPANLNQLTVMELYGWRRPSQAAAYVRPRLETLLAGSNAVAAHVAHLIAPASAAAASCEPQPDLRQELADARA